jgi:hypothetical protein
MFWLSIVILLSLDFITSITLNSTAKIVVLTLGAHPTSIGEGKIWVLGCTISGGIARLTTISNLALALVRRRRLFAILWLLAGITAILRAISHIVHILEGVISFERYKVYIIFFSHLLVILINHLATLSIA